MRFTDSMESDSCSHEYFTGTGVVYAGTALSTG